MILQTSQTQEIADLLKSGKVGILPTDTIYGLHCLATDQALIDKIYTFKRRPEGTRFITIISSIEDLKIFGVQTDDFEREQIDKFWPGPNTLIFKDQAGEMRSFRIPNNEFLIKILSVTGPLISTSANFHSQPFAATVDEAIANFGEEVDFYVDGGELDNPPSSMYRIFDGKIEKIR